MAKDPQIVKLDDVGGGVTYVGEAQAGSDDTDFAWLIYRLDESVANDLVKLYAEGRTSHTLQWSARTTYTYS
jgi:hypothetical protein